ncbi:hypothetical protein MY1884_008427 [Beauveria asiatica]
MRRTQGFAGRDRISQSRVNTWRRENRMVLLRGLPLDTLPEEFEEACRARLSQHQSLQFEWELSCNAWRKHRGRVALGFENTDVCAEAERRLAGWPSKFHPICMNKVTKLRPPRTSSNSVTGTESTTNNPSLLTEKPPSDIAKSLSSPQTTNETATVRRPISQAPPAAETIDLTAGSPPAPGRPLTLTLRLSTPVNVPCAAAAAVQEASFIAAETAAAADAAVAEAHAAAFCGFRAEEAGDIAAAASAQEQASAAEERARSAYGAAATAARIASAYSSCISPRDDFCPYG